MLESYGNSVFQFSVFYLYSVKPGYLTFFAAVNLVIEFVLLNFRWRLQQAFFTKESVGFLGCNGIRCRDFFPILSRYRPEKHDPAKEPLVMDDLKQVKPQYISNVAVDYWRKKPILKEPSYAIMALSPSENERIDHQPGEPGVEDKLCPKYVNQTDAMVTSAAVMALSPEQEEPFRDLQMLLGFTLRKGIRSNPKESFGCGGNRDEIASKVGYKVKRNIRKTQKTE